jgi:hypothetical protein
MSQWRSEHEASEADFFHQKCVLFHALLDLTPSDVTKERVFNNYLNFLKLNRFQRESLIEWYWKVRELNRRLNTPDKAERAWMLESLSASGDQVLQLMAKLETVLRPLTQNKR